jgi:hypothetical protein
LRKTGGVSSLAENSVLSLENARASSTAACKSASSQSVIAFSRLGIIVIKFGGKLNFVYALCNLASAST